jgi:hypothetical protein
LAKIEVETLPLIWGDSACIFKEVVLEVEKAVQEMLKLIKFADVYAVSELVEEFNERGELLDSGLDFRLKDLDTVFALNFLEVDEDWLWGNRSG